MAWFWCGYAYTASTTRAADVSAALQGHKGEKWTPEELNKWLTNPQIFAKGTKMTFAGLPKAKDRADVIAYLNSLSDNPKPLTAKD